MPNKHGPGTYKGFQSPNTEGWPPEIREEVRRVYGAYREKHPQENHEVKARGARIAWAEARRKYPEAYRQHVSLIKRESRQELKEHPWTGKRNAMRIAEDHAREGKLEPVQVMPARTEKARKHRRSPRGCKTGKRMGKDRA